MANEDRDYGGRELNESGVVRDNQEPNKLSLLERLSGRTHQIKDWVSSASAGWVFYTSAMTPIEYYGVGMSGPEVLKSRIINAMLGHSIGLPLYQKSKEIMYRAFKVSEESSRLKKRAVDALAFVPVHPPTYAFFLACSGVSLEEMKTAIPAGLAVVIATSPVFSPFMEWWRTKVLRQKSTYEKVDLSEVASEDEK